MMNTVLTCDRESAVGTQVRRLRISLGMTRRKLAELTGVSLEEVNLFEHSLPVRLDARRRLLRELWARKVTS